MTSDLITRLADGTGADRKLDLEICEHFQQSPRSYRRVNDSYQHYVSERDNVLFWEWPHYCTSLDACIALAEKVVPGCRWTLLYSSFRKIGVAEIEPSDNAFAKEAQHQDYCRAFLIALLKVVNEWKEPTFEGVEVEDYER